MATIAFDEVYDVLLLVHTEAPPTDEEWDRYVAFGARYLFAAHRPRVLVVTPGGSPTPAQRQRIVAITTPAPSYRDMKTAVVSDATFPRGVAQAFRADEPSFELFDSRTLDDALRYLDVAPGASLELKKKLHALQAQLRASP